MEAGAILITILWGLRKIQVDQAWNYTRGNGVVIAVVDTGVDYNHPDFDITANAWINESERNGNDANCYDWQDNDGNGKVDDCWGWDFTDNNNGPMDGYGTDTGADGHGTHVAGIMGAKENNGLGIVGVAHGARYMILRAAGDVTERVAAINYAVFEGADIINCSWGTISYADPALAAALDNARAAGVAVVASAGNYYRAVTTQNLPASHIGAITIGASTTADLSSNFSNYGKFVDLVAPGGDNDNGNGDYNAFENPADDPRHNILSLKSGGEHFSFPVPWLVINTNYYRLGGTSMSAPHVAGVAALIMSAESNYLTLGNIYDVLRVSSDDITAYGKGVDDQTGFGRLNAYKAVTNRCLTPYADVNPNPWPPGGDSTNIKTITCRGIPTVCTSSNYCPYNNMTEAAAAAFVIRAKYTDNFTSGTQPHFSDVPANHPFFKYIQKMKEDGISTVPEGGMYYPDNPIDRAKAAQYIIRANYGGTFQYTTSPPFFTDVPQTHWAYPYIQKMRDENITTYLSDCGRSRYCPAGITNRGQMASFIATAPFKIWKKGRPEPN